jgi:hypothetical protein
VDVVRGDSSNIDLALQIELTESGGGIEDFMVTSEGDREVDLEGFRDEPRVREGQRLIHRRAGERGHPVVSRWVRVDRPDVVDADGDELAATFDAGGVLTLRPGDQVALLDIRGAIVDTISLWNGRSFESPGLAIIRNGLLRPTWAVPSGLPRLLKGWEPLPDP